LYPKGTLHRSAIDFVKGEQKVRFEVAPACSGFAAEATFQETLNLKTSFTL
jgi:hypothetical protein